jgi:serine/threonine-protein kinase RIO1
MERVAIHFVRIGPFTQGVRNRRHTVKDWQLPEFEEISEQIERVKTCEPVPKPRRILVRRHIGICMKVRFRSGCA